MAFIGEKERDESGIAFGTSIATRFGYRLGLDCLGTVNAATDLASRAVITGSQLYNNA